MAGLELRAFLPVRSRIRRYGGSGGVRGGVRRGTRTKGEPGSKIRVGGWARLQFTTHDRKRLPKSSVGIMLLVLQLWTIFMRFMESLTNTLEAKSPPR